jgi:hypothetical protein
MDLARSLPMLLPRAIAWATAESRRALESGTPLDGDGLEIARRVGVVSPRKVRTIIAGGLPTPDDPFLLAAARESGLLVPETTGLTLGYAIFVRAGHWGRRILSHECRHVSQYEACGGIAGFLPAYLMQIATVGYSEAPLEIDARDHEIP